MKGEEKVDLPLPPREAEPPEPAAAGGRRRAAAESAEEGDHDPALFEELRALRRQIADGLHVPAYRVFNDRTLRAMARAVPRTEAELLEIPGVGKVTLEHFGARFLEVLRAYGARSSPG
jgi:ATP-dependent DNA helicase RecQ